MVAQEGVMHFRLIDYILWWISPCLQVVMLVVMRRRGLDRQFCFFYAYTILQVLSAVFLLTMYRISYAAYFSAYWVMAALSILISLALVDELFRLAFVKFEALRDFGRMVFRWAAIILLLAALVTVLASWHSLGNNHLASLFTADRGARAVLCALVVLLLLGRKQLSISPRSVLFGIALGFAIFALTKVALDTGALIHPELTWTMGHINSAVYFVACCVWLGYAWRGNILATTKLATAINQPSESLSPHLRGTPVLEMINATVEQAMKRNY